jgi:hypothetical protein
VGIKNELKNPNTINQNKKDIILLVFTEVDPKCSKTLEVDKALNNNKEITR